MTEKEILHRKERKKARRKARKAAMTNEQWVIHAEQEAQKVFTGHRLLKSFLEPLVEESKQREIQNNIVEE